MKQTTTKAYLLPMPTAGHSFKRIGTGGFCVTIQSLPGLGTVLFPVGFWDKPIPWPATRQRLRRSFSAMAASPEFDRCVGARSIWIWMESLQAPWPLVRNVLAWYDSSYRRQTCFKWFGRVLATCPQSSVPRVTWIDVMPNGTSAAMAIWSFIHITPVVVGRFCFLMS